MIDKPVASSALLDSPKLAASVGGATSALGITNLVGTIQPYVGLAATTAGLVLTVVLIGNHWLQRKKLLLEIRKIEQDKTPA